VNGGPGTDGAREGLLEPLRADPARAAILTDVDGALAPIVARPELAAVPERAREALARLSERYGLVGCVSGRRAAEARRLVGVEGIAYAGNHGLEVLAPGEDEPRLDPALHGRAGDAADFLAALGAGTEAGRGSAAGVGREHREPAAAEGAGGAPSVAGLDAEALAATGLRVEDKGPIQALHWRGAADEAAAEARAREIAAAAEGAGLHPHWGRKVLELRPLAEVGKDVAVRALLSSFSPGAGTTPPSGATPPKGAAPPRAATARPSTGAGGQCDVAIYAGDDRTDLDAFRGLRELRDEGALKAAICVGIVSPEAPPDLAAQSDGPAGWLAILEALAR
jgi:trehalose 6-phosphate phosphatase